MNRLDLDLLELDDVSCRRLVRDVVAGASPELARRRAENSPLLLVGRWLKPTVAAAALVILASGTVITRTRADSAPRVLPGNGIVEALAVPRPADAWLVADREPTVNDLILLLEQGAR